MSVKLMSTVWDLQTESHTQKLVLLALADNANDSSACWPSIKNIAAKCNLSVRAVYNQIDRLAELKLLILEHRFTKEGRQTSNLYRLTLHGVQGRDALDAEGIVNGVHGESAPDADTGVLGMHTNHNRNHQSNHQKEPVTHIAEGETQKSYHKHSRTVLFYLNEKTGHHYRETDPNLKFISARLSEPEVDLDGIKVMIDRQIQEWKDTAMEKYLRPETLFNRTKFDSYYASRLIPASKTHLGNHSKGFDRNKGTCNEGKSSQYDMRAIQAKGGLPNLVICGSDKPAQ